MRVYIYMCVRYVNVGRGEMLFFFGVYVYICVHASAIGWRQDS